MPVSEFVDTLFIGGGVMLFLGGIIMLVIPGLFRTGILTTVIADILFVSRMLFPDSVDALVSAETSWQPLIDSASLNMARVYTAVLVFCTLIAILCLRAFIRMIFGTSKPAKNKSVNRNSSPKKKSSRAKIQRDRDDFSGYEADTELPPEPEQYSPTHTKRFRVHDYLENLEKQQAYEESLKQRKNTDNEEPTIHFDRIER